MDIVVQKTSPIGIREQIKRQIRMLIERGALHPGQLLPSARDLAAVLKVNRNTVAQTYKELSSEGLVTIVRGSGTFVKADLAVRPRQALDRIFDQAVQSARQSGFNTTEIAEYLFNQSVALTVDVCKKRILVVDCNDEVVGYLCARLSEELGADAQGVLIQEIEADPSGAAAFFEGRDLVVCGFNHLQELEAAVPDLGVDVVAVLLQVDVRVINELAQLPRGTTAGFVCANQRSTETLYNSAYFSGGKELRRILAGYDNSRQLKKLLRQCDVIFATHFVYDRIIKLAAPRQRVIKVHIAMDSGSMDLIKEKLIDGKERIHSDDRK